MTVCDRRHLAPGSAVRQRASLGRSNAKVAVAVQPQRFWERFIEVVTTYP